MKKIIPFIPYIAIAAAGYWAYKKFSGSLLPALQNIGSEAGQKAFDVLHPTEATAQAHDDAYQLALKAIIARNPQYTPSLIKRYLISIQWKLGDSIPDSGLHLR